MNSKVFSSAFFDSPDGFRAVEEVTRSAEAELRGQSCDLAVLFVSEAYPQPVSLLLEEFGKRLSAKCLIACNSSGIIGDDRELEMQPGISLLAMHLPEVRVQPFTLSPMEIELLGEGDDFVSSLDLYPTDNPKFICLADPASCDVIKLLELFNGAYPDSPVIGGLASGNVVGAKNWIALNGEIYEQGAVAVALSGKIRFETCISQGCRPIGEPLAVTKAENNILYELGGKPALKAFKEVYKTLNPQDQMLAQTALFVGLAMDESQTAFRRGDFLIRNIMGVDQTSGALSIGAMLQPGQTLQFQLRDAKTSQEDLEILLKQMHDTQNAGSRGAILVSCCGRGRGLYGEEDHDIRLIQKLQGPLRVAGFFASGEFGPVRQRNYIHGYTSSLTLIY